MSLATNLECLRRDVGRFLGYDREPGSWTIEELEDVDGVIAEGLRQFYRPPRLPQERQAHQWSFLRPIGTLAIEADVDEYDLPADFADLDGDIYYVQAEHMPFRIRTVHAGRILELRQRNEFANTSVHPRESAIVPIQPDGTANQIYRLMLWPKPGSAYTLKFRYYARQQMLTDDADVPLGGTEHAGTIRAACLSAAESFLDDERGVKYQDFLDQLAASIDFDRKANSPSTLGYMGDNSDSRGMDPYIRSPNITTYEKFPL